ncbi:hypothetical protein [Paraburkholderia kirstenboschensis]|uniref:Uncharacterized protein n=1 Tax=Paraburkholderia kirstenboschensis TaxID=1245436 RepID=A0ABZ0EUH3_9BURK|nr:hypothetical protein [Paraburkholderia kirstenboschensis]WOD20309.1 hypothetical protein RW095_29385 [Paraburkholderia kirstenboschensis]
MDIKIVNNFCLDHRQFLQRSVRRRRAAWPKAPPVLVKAGFDMMIGVAGATHFVDKMVERGGFALR